MHSVDTSLVSSWKNGTKNIWYPAAIDLNCPYCTRSVTFSLEGPTFELPRNTYICHGGCPRCHKQISVWAIEPSVPPIDPTCNALMVYPQPHEERQPIPGLESISPPLKKAYIGCVRVYNTREWNGTAALCRRTLEGLLKAILPAGKVRGSLAQQLAQLPTQIKLDQPLHTMANMIREGGNLGAHLMKIVNTMR